MATSRFTPAERGRQMASPRPKTRDSKDTLCRNILIYGKCRYENQGCAFNHDQNKADSFENSMKKSLNVDSPAFTPAQLQSGTKKFTFSSQTVNATPFTPKGGAQDGDVSGGGVFNPAAIREFTPQVPQNYDLHATGTTNGVTPEASGSVHDPFFAMSSMAQTLPAAQYNPYAEDQNHLAAAGGSYYTSQTGYTAPMQPLQYHLYAPTGPYKQDLTPYQRQPHDFFLREDIREELHKKADATRQVLPNSQLPTVSNHYHSLVPLDTPRSGANFFGNYVSWVYKATSKKNGHTYCLRRLQGLRLNNVESVRGIQSWKRISNGNVVSVIECFTSRDFSDNSLVFIHNYHPLSKTLAEHHFNTAQGSRYTRQFSVPESILWSYICQICNALKAIHAEKLAARCIDASKVILTDKNRVRLGGCAILDVLDYESTQPLVDMQQEDFIQLGRLILSIGTNTPALGSPQTVIPQSALEQFGRTYSVELRERVIWLLSRPSPQETAQKNILELACGLSSHFVDCFDTSLHAQDEVNSNLMRELENGRIARLVMKLGTINERPEFDNDPSWSENGERYQLKLFRDYVFHQVDSSGHPVLDLGHMISSLNKLDAGIDERIHLASRDNQTVFVVSYKELKKMVANCFNELAKPHGKQASRGF
ncbi:PAB-dependent poly(A)-specific ribonuclease subunit PAN3 [Pseudomassariella vexata]|uniref:PAN2-PAN3 deadenylation complex subunit PAN3 n=1 Tax=Pseudomassariella vexata TaxID=1141098 RepID=A0A1Y2E7C7_9PEZI|nr:PAB-dependent poly(A)-specific ribonuclease subunit PAN3 [Pseudomassariella vexata]ORY67440.1 PAB-dependent poly(A)-specific ribonuclease subunit PAN3 [Pseudomassariella vexata]